MSDTVLKGATDAAQADTKGLPAVASAGSLTASAPSWRKGIDLGLALTATAAVGVVALLSLPEGDSAILRICAGAAGAAAAVGATTSIIRNVREHALGKDVSALPDGGWRDVLRVALVVLAMVVGAEVGIAVRDEAQLRFVHEGLDRALAKLPAAYATLKDVADNAEARPAGQADTSEVKEAKAAVLAACNQAEQALKSLPRMQLFGRRSAAESETLYIVCQVVQNIQMHHWKFVHDGRDERQPRERCRWFEQNFGELSDWTARTCLAAPTNCAGLK